MVRELVGAGEFIEVFVDTPIDECRSARPEGALRARRDAGEIKQLHRHRLALRGADRPEIHLTTLDAGPEALAEQVIADLRRRGIIV